MRRILFALLLTTVSLSADITPEGVERLEELRERFSGPTVRVQLLRGAEGAQVEVKGAYNVYDPRTGKKLDSAYLSSSYYMNPTVDGLKWGQEFPGIFQLLLVPDKNNTTVLVGGTEYRGMAYVYQIKGTLNAVNEVSIDDFVASLLSSHVSQDIADKEALAALAIALRTETLSWMAQGNNPYWDLKAETVGYLGSSIERRDAPFVEALKATRGLVVKKAKSQNLVDIHWFALGETMAPVLEMVQAAQEGKDARAILEKLLGNVQIVKIESLHS